MTSTMSQHDRVAQFIRSYLETVGAMITFEDTRTQQSEGAIARGVSEEMIQDSTSLILSREVIDIILWLDDVECCKITFCAARQQSVMSVYIYTEDQDEIINIQTLVTDYLK